MQIKPLTSFYFRCQNDSNSESHKCDIGDIFQNSKCQKCPGDTYADKELNRCLACPHGFNCENGNKIACPPGSFYQDGDCTDCSAGYYCLGGSKTPRKCPIGRFSEPGSARCSTSQKRTDTKEETHLRRKRFSDLDCSPGQFPDGNTCSPCPAGTYGPDGSACITCTTGHAATAGQSTCNSCADNQIISSANSCTDCPTGQVPNGAKTECIPCPAGHTCATSDDFSICPNGYFRLVTDPIEACIECSAGFHCPDATVAIECPNGYFSEALSTYCTQVPAGYGQNINNKTPTGLTQCAAGQYSELGDTVCNDCSRGFYCPGTDQGMVQNWGFT